MNARFFALFSMCWCLASTVCTAAELRHFWDFEGDEWWLDKAGEAHGDAPVESSSIEIDVGAGDVGSSISVQTAIAGGDDHLQLDSGELFVPGAEAFSFSYWIKLPDDGTSDPRGIFDFSGNGRDGVQSLYIGTTGELAFRIDFPGAGNALAKVSLNLEDGEWHSVVATYDPAAGLEVHVDGFGVDGSAAAVAGSVAMDSDSYIGSFNFTGTAANKGIGGGIDDLAIYSGVLTEEEIRALAVRIKPPIEITSVDHDEGGLTVTWTGREGEVFSVWSSLDLGPWTEENDSVIADAEGGTFTLTFSDPAPERAFLQVRRFEQ